MRDRRFIAEHRGGLLSKGDHRLIALWAADCAERAMATAGVADKPRLVEALRVARAWGRGEATVGDAQKAAVAAHACAREAEHPAAVAAARAAGHAVATAHMADHGLGAAGYALKAVDAAGLDLSAERRRQDDQLPPSIREIVLDARSGPRMKLFERPARRRV
jgi:hypothetical protein